MYSIYLDEALLVAAGLSDFPEYYAYILERVQEPVLPAQRIPIGEQTLQQQVKDNDDILYNKNEVFVPPVSNAPTKLDLSSQLERSRFLASSGSDPQLIVYSDHVTLSVSYETTGLFSNGYLFKSYPEEARPKAGKKVLALVGTDTTKKINRRGKQIMIQIIMGEQIYLILGLLIAKIGRIPDVLLPADGKNMGFRTSVYRNAGEYINWLAKCSRSYS
ncbi:MAG: hypothetical protein EZS28_011923 [Streblomastix strix]|uniref:Uncharacterized protein n=1 Tax=Streblomastix strix TaxID=222440 RepID=A0A5J4WCJ3_9EUKA|nr:MAG: hypothetical protein EZS28_011923 [Streblomastix strix]